MGKIQEMSLRHLSYLNNNLVIHFNENMLVIDISCDQTIININAFLIKYFAGIKFNIGGALNSMKSTKLKLINDAYTLLTLPNHVKKKKLTKLFWIIIQLKLRPFSNHIK